MRARIVEKLRAGEIEVTAVDWTMRGIVPAISIIDTELDASLTAVGRHLRMMSPITDEVELLEGAYHALAASKALEGLDSWALHIVDRVANHLYLPGQQMELGDNVFPEGWWAGVRAPLLDRHQPMSMPVAEALERWERNWRLSGGVIQDEMSDLLGRISIVRPIRPSQVFTERPAGQ